MKRKFSSDSSQASFVTADSQAFEPQVAPESLNRTVSPPPPTRKKLNLHRQKPATAAVEAGKVNVEDHGSFFSEKLLAARLPDALGRPQLDHTQWLNLYKRNLNDSGHHFVVHQHDHPVAGTHYDLRLQCNATSSISFAIMYGLPGDPNSKKLARNATETRVHNLWNHLIETASHETGTMLIWDTGEYEVLPYYKEHHRESTPDYTSESDAQETTTTRGNSSSLSEPAKLAQSFTRRKIRLRLHGTRLPPNYTIGMRLTMDNFRSTQPKAQTHKRGRKATQLSVTPSNSNYKQIATSSSSSSGSLSPHPTTYHKLHGKVSSLQRTASPPLRNPRPIPQAKPQTPNFVPSTARTADDAPKHALLPPASGDSASASAPVSEDESEQIRLTNAYPGAHNSINSIHQRKWYLSLDRRRSGFVQVPTPEGVVHHARTCWVRGGGKGEGERKGKGEWTGRLENKVGDGFEGGNKSGFEKFHVLGREVERSVVTGRLASDILKDEDVKGYIPRGKWRGVVE